MENLKLSIGCALIALVTLGAFGVKDGSQAKLPLSAIAGIIGWAYFSTRSAKP